MPTGFILFKCPFFSILVVMHQHHMSAVCRGNDALVFVWELEADRAAYVTLHSPLPRGESGAPVLHGSDGVPWQDQLRVTPSPLCHKKRVLHLSKENSGSLLPPYVLQHWQGRKLQVTGILKFVLSTNLPATWRFPIPRSWMYWGCQI